MIQTVTSLKPVQNDLTSATRTLTETTRVILGRVLLRAEQIRVLYRRQGAGQERP